MSAEASSAWDGNVTFAVPCPASIWLLGSSAPCSKTVGPDGKHEGDHEVKITWRVG